MWMAHALMCPSPPTHMNMSNNMRFCFRFSVVSYHSTMSACVLCNHKHEVETVVRISIGKPKQ